MTTPANDEAQMARIVKMIEAVWSRKDEMKEFMSRTQENTQALSDLCVAIEAVLKKPTPDLLTPLLAGIRDISFPTPPAAEITVNVPEQQVVVMPAQMRGLEVTVTQRDGNDRIRRFVITPVGQTDSLS